MTNSALGFLTPAGDDLSPAVGVYQSEKMQYTDEQQKAIKELSTFLAKDWDRNNFEYLLKGSAGTGKTTIVKEVLRDFEDEIILGTALSHAAKNVLMTVSGSAMQGVDTLAATLGLRPIINAKGQEVFVWNEGGNKMLPIKDASILIVDEASMVDGKMLSYIRQLVPYGCKIIYMGDAYQLPPVDETTNEDSPVFRLRNQSELTKPMRFDEIIGETAYFYRDLIHQINTFNTFDSAAFYSHRPIKHNFNSSIEFTSDNYRFLEKVLSSFQHDPTNTRVLAYRNTTIDAYNKYIRKFFYPEDVWYCAGEIIIMNKPFGQEVYNGEMYQVTKVVEGNLPVKYKKDRKDSITTIPVYNLTIQHLSSTKVAEIPVIHPESMHIYNDISAELKNLALADRFLWKNYYDFIKKFADCSYGFVTSTHKAQGQTIDNVFVIADDILEVQKTTLKVKMQSLYVSATRAKRNLTVLLK